VTDGRLSLHCRHTATRAHIPTTHSPHALLTNVNDRPADQPRAKFRKLLQVEVTDARVQLAADEVVVDGAAGVAATGEDLALGDEGGQVPM
jgi:hypothetical protein